jgi:hypothetical protein
MDKTLADIPNQVEPKLEVSTIQPTEIHLHHGNAVEPTNGTQVQCAEPKRGPSFLHADKFGHPVVNFLTSRRVIR